VLASIFARMSAAHRSELRTASARGTIRKEQRMEEKKIQRRDQDTLRAEQAALRREWTSANHERRLAVSASAASSRKSQHAAAATAARAHKDALHLLESRDLVEHQHMRLLNHRRWHLHRDRILRVCAVSALMAPQDAQELHDAIVLAVELAQSAYESRTTFFSSFSSSSSSRATPTSANRLPASDQSREALDACAADATRMDVRSDGMLASVGADSTAASAGQTRAAEELDAECASLCSAG
jgi:hypothetical protein